MRSATLLRLASIAAGIGLAASAAWSSGATSLAAPAPQAPAARTYAMGWAATPPVMTTGSILATAQSMSSVAEYALVQREVPWTALLGGTSVDAELTNEQPFVDYLRSLGLKIVWLVDPLDGLDRTKEPPDLVAAGHSLLEPQVLAMHEDWVRGVAQRFHPEYVGLASEINTLRAHGSVTLYDTIVGMVNTLTPAVHTLDPGAVVFVSFQMEDAWQRPPFPASTVDHFTLIADFHVDALGLSSYPSYSFAHPADMPPDYYQRFAAATPLPLLQVEGGWSSVASAWGGGSPADQAAYIDRLGALLDGVRARLWVSLIYADLNLADPSWNLPPDRAATLQNFASQGIVDSNFVPKPAYSHWQALFARPLVSPGMSVGGIAEQVSLPPRASGGNGRGGEALVAVAVAALAGVARWWRRRRRARRAT
ncbi:MAG TPA: hypothetical protein VEZ14_04740 [Dehalococcoidia bacterium]|nr:hypothetical protein [Dehalococcoidia bacterium]